MTPAGRPDPTAFLAPDGVLIPAQLARELLDELAPVAALLNRTRTRPLSGDLWATLQALAWAEVCAATPTPADPPPTGPWLSVAEAAAAVGCSPRRVRQLAASGTVNARRHGARPWSIDLASLRAHYSGRRGAPAAVSGTAPTPSTRLVA